MQTVGRKGGSNIDAKVKELPRLVITRATEKAREQAAAESTLAERVTRLEAAVKELQEWQRG